MVNFPGKSRVFDSPYLGGV